MLTSDGQYPDGLAGPFVIHGPSSSNWDIDLGPVLIQDYVHDSAFVRYDVEKAGGLAYADSLVVNGVGHDPLTGTGQYFNTTFTKGKKHVLRLINGSAGTHYIFSIDGHNMTVIENDLVPIEPYVTTSLSIGIGKSLVEKRHYYEVFGSALLTLQRFLRPTLHRHRRGEPRFG